MYCIYVHFHCRPGSFIHGLFQIRGNKTINVLLRQVCAGKINLNDDNMKDARHTLGCCQPLTNLLAAEQKANQNQFKVSTELNDLVEFIIQAVNVPLKNPIPRPVIEDGNQIQNRSSEYFPELKPIR